MTPELNHQSKAYLSLLVPFLAKPYITTLTVVLAGKIQELEDAAYNTVLAFLVDSAVGDALSKIGKFVGQINLGWSDADYRLMVKARILANISNGRRDDILGVLALFHSGSYELEQQGPALLRLLIEGATAAGVDRDLLFYALRLTKGHGVGMQYVYSPSALAGMRWAGTGESATATNSWAGTGETTPELFGIEVI